MLSFQDIDECLTTADNNCSSDGKCINMAGGFTCACNNGFSGDGVNCTGVFIMSRNLPLFITLFVKIG